MESCPKAGFITKYNEGLDRAALAVGDSPEDIEALNETIEWSQALAERLNPCNECSGMIVDLSNGKLYCGRERPQEVFKSNIRIQLN